MAHQRMRRVGVVVVALTVAMSSMGPASAGPPVRSGTILVAARPTNGLGPWPGCDGMPDCAAWRLTCQQPPPTTVGAMSSIVDVRKLRRSTLRTFRVVDERTRAGSRSVTVEFWDARCFRIHLRDDSLDDVMWARFKIPRRAAWMTVTSPCGWLCLSFGGVELRWELR